MSNAVDNRVVQLEMDNGSFERNANQSIRTLDKLDNALNFKNGGRSFEEVEAAAAKCNFKPLLSAADTVVHKFSAMEIAGITAIQNITNRVVDAGIQMAKSLSVDQVSTGFAKYEQKASNVQTLINSTGKSIDEVNKYLDRLMWFSDETSYGFTDMTQALATMVNAGGDIDKITPMIEGIANSVAFAGKGAAEFNRVIYNLNQSYGQGYLTYMDWKSVQLAGANSKQLVETFIRAGEEAGTIKKGEVTIDNFTNTLSKKWANREVMENAFGYFDEMTQKAYEMIGTVDDEGNTIETATQAYEILSKKYDGVSLKAAKAAQEAKSFSEAIGATKDAVSSGWMKTFEIIIGDYNQARDLWSGVAEGLWEIFAGGFEERNNKLKEAFQSSPVEKFAANVKEAGISFDEFKDKVKESYLEMNKGKSEEDFTEMTEGIETVSDLLKQSWVDSTLLQKTLDKFPKIMGETSKNTKAAKADIRDLIKDVNSGKYGYGLEEQQKRLAEAGIDGSSLGGNWLQQLYNTVASGNEEAINSINETIGGISDVTDGVDETNDAIDKQKDLWKDLSKQAKEFDNEYYSSETGRTLMLDGFKNIIGAIGDRLGVVKEAWDKAFPAITAERIREILVSFNFLTTKLKMTSEEGEKLGSTFDKIFSVLSKIKEFVKSVLLLRYAVTKLAVRFAQWFFTLPAITSAIDRIKTKIGELYHRIFAGGLTAKINELREKLNSLTSEDFDRFKNKIMLLYRAIKSGDLTEVSDSDDISNGLKVVATVLSKIVGLTKKLYNQAKRLYKVLSPIVQNGWEWIKNVGTSFWKNVAVPFGNFVKEVISSEDPLATLISGIKQFGSKALQSIRKLWNYLSNVKLSNFLDKFQQKFPKLYDTISKIGTTLEDLITKGDDAKKSLDFSKILSLGTMAAILMMFAKLGQALVSLQMAADSIKVAFFNINKIFVTKFGNTFAGNVRTIALSIVALAGSLYLIADIPSDKLWAATGALIAMMAVMAIIAGIMTVVSKKMGEDTGKNLTNFVKPILAMSVAILIVSIAIKNAAKALEGCEGFGETFTKVIGILGLIGGIGLEIIALASLMSLVRGKITFAAVVMILVATAIITIVNALGALQNLKLSDDAAQAIIWVSIVATISAIASAVSSIKRPGNSLNGFTNVVLSLVGIITAIYVTMLAIEKLKTLKFEEIKSKWKEIVAVIVIVGAVALLVAGLGRLLKPASKAVAALGIGTFALIGAIALLVNLMEKVSEMGNAGRIIKASEALQNIGYMLAVLVVALGAASAISDGGKGVFRISLSILMMVVAIGAMVALMKIVDILFSETPEEKLKRLGIIFAALVGAMVALSLAVGLAGKLGGGKGIGAIVAAVAGVVVLGSMLIVLSSFKWEQLKGPMYAIIGVCIGLGLLMVAIGGAVKLATSGKGGWIGLFNAVLMIIAIAGALVVLSKMPTENLAYAVVAIAVSMVAVAGALKMMSMIDFNLKTLGNVVVGLAMFAAVAWTIKTLLVPAFTALAEIPFDSFWKNMLVFVLGIGLLVGGLTAIAAIAVASGVGAVALVAVFAILVGVALVGLSIAAMFGVFAWGVTQLASLPLADIANGLKAMAGPMALVGLAGILLALGAVGIALFAGAIYLLGLAAESSSSGIVNLGLAFEYILSILSAIGSAFESSSTGFLGGLANLDKELSEKTDSFVQNAEKIREAFKPISEDGESPDMGGEEMAATTAEGITANTDVVADAAKTAVEEAGNAGVKVAAKKGTEAGNSYITAAANKIKSFGSGKLEEFGITGEGGFESLLTNGQFDMSAMAEKIGIDPGMLENMGQSDMMSYLQGLQNGTTDMTGQTAEAGKNLADQLTTSVETEMEGKSERVGSSIKKMLITAVTGIDLGGISNILSGNFITKFGESLINGLNGGEGATGAGGEGATTGIDDALTQFLTSLVNDAGFGASGAAGANEFAGEFSNTVESGENQGKAKSAGTVLANSGNSGLSSVSTFASGANFGQGFANGILSKVQAVAAAAAELANAATSSLNTGIDAHSPSRIAMKSGSYFTEGFIIGIDMRTMYAAAAAYKMGSDSIDALNAGIQNGEITRVMPVLDTSDLYNQMDEFDGIYRPIIKPTLDMSDIDPAYRNMTAVATARYSGYDGESGPQGASVSGGSVVNYTQNNYSPKALSSVEIYRQTKNQLNSLEKRFAKK